MPTLRWSPLALRGCAAGAPTARPFGLPSVLRPPLCVLLRYVLTGPPRPAPQVGNPAFSWLYRSLVPNTFGVVNDQDPVPRVPATGGSMLLRGCRLLSLPSWRWCEQL